MSHTISPFRFMVDNFDAFSRSFPVPGSDNDENEMVALLLPSIRKFARDKIDALKIDKEKGIPPAVLGEAKEMGLFGLTVPVEYGGSGLSLKAACYVIAELAYYDSAVSTTMGLHNGLGLRGLIAFGSSELKDLYLGELAAGKKIAAFAATETGAGSHISNVQTRAVPDEKGEHLIVNGGKIYVTNGALADVYTILASTPELGGHKGGLSLLLIPRSSPGVIVGEEEDKLGLRGSSTTSLYFEDVKVRVDHIIGIPGEALGHFEDVLSWGRTLMSAGCLGTSRNAYEKAIRYALIRKQFGEMISRFALVQEKISRMAQYLFAMDSVIKSVGQMDTLGKNIVFESSVAKILSSEGAGWICDEAIQIHGGSGFIEETGLAKLYRDVRITRIFEGTNEMLRLHIALQVLSWAKEELENRLTLPVVDDSLKSHWEDCQSAYGGFLSTLAFLKSRYKFSLLKKQLSLKSLADSAIALYTAFSVLMHVNSILKTRIPEKRREYYLLLSRAILFEQNQKIRSIQASVESEQPYTHEELANQEYGSNE